MMKKKTVLMILVTAALVAAALPMVGLKVGAARETAESRPKHNHPNELATPPTTPAPAQREEQFFLPADPPDPALEQPYDPALIKRLGMTHLQGGAEESMQIAREIERRYRRGETGGGSRGKSQSSLTPQSNEPAILAANGAFSAAVATTIGGRDTQFDDVELLADWDGREDFTADRQGTVDDFSQKIPAGA